MALKILPQNISNLIAAGEVVQRPSSVVKELVENSIDAEATSISVIIEDSGRTLIQVIDNGIGMTPEEAKLCFARHATSKIDSAEDLDAIVTYGFRGEALASIAAVSEVTLKTRKRGEETGSCTQFADSVFDSQNETACPEGTSIAVRNIFYNTPARRKFLKSDATEFRQILSEFSRVALVRPQIAFKLLHNGRTVFDLKKASTIKKRILETEGNALGKELIDLEVETSLIKMSGYVGDPKDARKGAINQFFFINGRFFRSAYFHKAIAKAYEKLVPEGYSPSYFIYMECDPSAVDINIHPSKTEVKFENEPAIFEILNAAVRESLGKNAFVPSIDFDMEGVPEMPPATGSGFVHPPIIDYSPLFDPFRQDNGRFSSSTGSAARTSEPVFPGLNDFTPENLLSAEERKMNISDEPIADGYIPLVEDRTASSDFFLPVHGKYIITTVKSGVLLIHIGRSRERIFYERYLRSLDDSRPVTLGTLFPVIIDLTPSDYSVLMEDPERLRMLGFDIQSFGPSTVIVNGIPDGLSPETEAVRDTIFSLINTFNSAESLLVKKADVRQNIAASMSRSAAAGASRSFTAPEARALIESLFACAEPERTPDGRKTMDIISLEALDKIL